MVSSAAFFEAVKNRRSIYALGDGSPIPDAKIVEIVQEAVKHAPSSFNSQSTHVVIAFGEEHKKIWNITKEAIKAIVPAEAWPASEGRLNGFLGGHGTVLFYENRDDVKALQEKFPLYADKFAPWSQHASAIAQVITWTALEAEGLGANLQHYTPLIDAKVAKEFSVPDQWELVAQLVFGEKKAEAGEKAFKPIDERVKVFGL